MTRSTPGTDSTCQRPLVLGIESSCDDTACAVLDGEGRVLSSVVSSQLAAHRPYGGVVPEIASREHLRNWPSVRAQALDSAGVALADIDVVAATRGPGLVGSLLVGLSVGKAIAYGLEKPFFGVHHLEGHLYSPFLVRGPGSEPGAPPPPALPVPEEFVGLVVSGGHTALYSVVKGQAKDGASQRPAVETISETRDDAMGECFDKVGKRVGLPFPGGPQVDRLAELAMLTKGSAELTAGPLREQARELLFRTPRCGDTLDFSYSGLKTQAIVEIEKLEREGLRLDAEELLRLAQVDPSDPSQAAALREGSTQRDAIQLLGAFRDAAVRQVLDRVRRRHRAEPMRHLAVSGGVAANVALRRALLQWGESAGVRVHLVPLAFCGDNAAMIAHAALRRHHQGETGDPLATDAVSRLAVR